MSVLTRFVLVLGLVLLPATLLAASNVTTPSASNTTAPPAGAKPTPQPVPSTPPPAPAPLPEPGKTLTDSVSVLIRLFVLAVILESALAIVFRWQPYLVNIDGRAANPLVSFIAALILVFLFPLDQIGKLIAAYSTEKGTPDSGIASTVITAMVLAGGSAGVNRMLRALGFRAIETEAEAAKPPQNKAWIAVVQKPSAVGVRREVIISTDGGTVWQLCGILAATTGVSSTWRWLLRDRRRFPPSGGYEVTPGTSITLALRPANGNPATVWGPGALAAGAILDIEV